MDEVKKETGAKIHYLMTLNNVSRRKLAAEIGVGCPMLSMTIWGEKTSPRVRAGIAKRLGFKNWEEIERLHMPYQNRSVS